jgi:hypothetical protein
MTDGLEIKKEDKEGERKENRGKTLALAAFAAFAFLTVFAAHAANAALEPAAVITLSFGKNASGSDALLLQDFKAGLAELPNYAAPARRAFEVRVLSAQGAALRSYWLADPRYSYYDVLGENGVLTGGVKFNANARFLIVVPVLDEAKYAAVFDSRGAKLIAIDLHTGLPVEEREWKEVALKIMPEEPAALGVGDIAVVAVAVVVAALLLLGLVIARKARARRKKQGE